MSEFTINMADAAAYSGIPVRSVMEVSLTGGEPLVRRDFMKIVDALLAGGIRITTIYSNGQLVTDKFLDQLAERGIHPEFNTSYDGLDDWHEQSGGVPSDSGVGAGQVHHRFLLYAADRHRATEVLNHNPECKTCEHTLQCLAGCRASALEFHPTAILAPDPAVCAIFKSGWVDISNAVMQEIDPEIHSRI